MPGLVVIITKTQKEKNELLLDIMIDCMLHEKFYSTGTYVNDEIGLYAGWVSHKGSYSDCLPITIKKDEIILLFYGENFIDENTEKDLNIHDRKDGVHDARILIELYNNKSNFYASLNGWFNGIIVDLKKQTIFLFNDRYGMQRIYYHETNDAFYFASEAKSLLKILPELKQIDFDSLSEFLCFGCVLDKKSLFKNIKVLPGGIKWEFTGSSKPKKQYYFKPEEWEKQEKLDKEDFYVQFRRTFAAIVPQYFRSKQSIGMSLTGGLDTRMIMAHANMAPGKLPCYTFKGIYRECYDVKLARKVAAACQQNYNVLHLGDKFLNDFAKHAERTIYISDGYLDVGGSPEIYMNKLAREIAPVRMTGNHGSEALRNVQFLRARMPNKNIYDNELKENFINALDLFESEANCNPVTFSVFKEAPMYHFNRLSVEQSQVTLRTPYMDNELIKLMYQAPKEIREDEEISLRVIADGNKKLRDIITDRGIGGNLKYPLSKAIQLYLEFLFLAEYAYDYGMPQWVAKCDGMLSWLHLEKLFLGRHKFYHFRIWYRDILSDYVKAILLDEKTLSRPYLVRSEVENIVNQHINGYRNYTTVISNLLTVELFHRLLIEEI